MTKISNKANLEVVDATLGDVFGDLARVHFDHRLHSKAGKIIKLSVEGRSVYAVARGLRAGMTKDKISLDSALREQLGVKPKIYYDFEIDRANWIGGIVWAWRSTNPVPRVAARLGAISVAVGVLGLIISLVSFCRT